MNELKQQIAILNQSVRDKDKEIDELKETILEFRAEQYEG